MLNIRKHIVLTTPIGPSLCKSDYEDWCRIEQALGQQDAPKPPTDLARHIGKLAWPVDGMEYQRKVRSEWN